MTIFSIKAGEESRATAVRILINKRPGGDINDNVYHDYDHGNNY